MRPKRPTPSQLLRGFGGRGRKKPNFVLTGATVHPSATDSQFERLLCRLGSGFKALDFHGCGHLKELAPLLHCQQLQRLDLADCLCISTFSVLAQCTGLRHLRLRGCQQLPDFSFAPSLILLEELDASGCARARGAPAPLGRCTQLRRLDLSGCRHLEGIEDLTDCTQLEEISVSGCVKLTALPKLSKSVSQAVDVKGSALLLSKA
eukprot:TRINITY_DN79414_c0_g1_i1.p1 TRINITY_DN79414_c0_g1~~TRINITY_DN79414_c0_g1_i1.p1  ORF type:complete len:206 (+),score=22.93 TRINITY_DN79414_c0_g1_i1:383-1000(+)